MVTPSFPDGVSIMRHFCANPQSKSISISNDADYSNRVVAVCENICPKEKLAYGEKRTGLELHSYIKGSFLTTGKKEILFQANGCGGSSWSGAGGAEHYFVLLNTETSSFSIINGEGDDLLDYSTFKTKTGKDILVGVENSYVGRKSYIQKISFSNSGIDKKSIVELDEITDKWGMSFADYIVKEEDDDLEHSFRVGVKFGPSECYRGCSVTDGSEKFTEFEFEYNDKSFIPTNETVALKSDIYSNRPF